MATRSFLHRVLRLAGIAVAAGALTAGSALLPAVPLQASTSAHPSSPAAGPGIIAYMRPSTHDIHAIAPDGAGGRVLWTAPHPLDLWGAFDLAWRPDGVELAFSSGHEETCSWYQSDVYAIRYDGAGYRRVTNAPACAVLATLPKGSVTVDVANYTSSLVWVYVAGAPGIKTALDYGTMTFNDVADFGPGVPQPSIGIWGLYRIMSGQPLADVQPNTTVPGGSVVFMQYSGISGFGAGKISWKADGSALAYAMHSLSSISQISATPSYGSIGQMLPVVEGASPGPVAWGPTAATKNQYLYFTTDNPFYENLEGIYLNTAGDVSGGTKVVYISTFYDAERVYDIEWLPDGSGFLFTKFYVNFEYFVDIFEYNFATQEVTQLTSFPDDRAYGFSISPDGRQVVFERVANDSNPTSSLWIMNRDGSGLHQLVDDAGSPAWGRVPTPPTPRGYLPVVRMK